MHDAVCLGNILCNVCICAISVGPSVKSDKRKSDPKKALTFTGPGSGK